MATFAMGDIHGGYRALMQCLERSGFNYDEDTLIQLGDVADGWSETPEAVEELLKIKNLIALRGNHDMWTRQWLIYGEVQRMWRTQGGKATSDAYARYALEHGDEHLERHRAFFASQHNYYIDDQNRGFVHGGFTSRKGLGHEPYESNYFWDRDLWSLAMLSHKRVHLTAELATDSLSSSTRFERHKEIFIGHTSTINWSNMEPMNKCNIWNLDTGGGFDGKLTIMNIDTKEFWQSDFVKDLYPDEMGR